jgi:Skp family chaperone for outer membrane proteins
MHIRTALWQAALAAVMTFIAASAIWAAPAETPPTQPTFAIVDMRKVTDGYKTLQQAKIDFNKFQDEIERKLTLSRALRLLDDNEVREIKDLRGSAILTADQKKRLQELESLSDAREQELTALGQKGAALTAEEKARRDALVAIAQKRAPTIEADEKQLTEERDNKNAEISVPLNQNIKNALDKLAKQHHVSAVFSKEVVVWAALDLTDPMINELNKPKP